MIRTLLMVGIAAAALAVVACQKQGGDDAAFGARVQAYLMAHPDDLQKALDHMQSYEQDAQAKTEALADAKAKSDLPALRAALERDPRDFVANPDGRVTVTEFYDYRCPHCINIAPKVVSLIRQHPDVRFVFKEMPIFGATSEHAARAALAAKAQGKDYVGLYEAFMAAHPLTDDAIDQLAAAKGVNLTEMNDPANVAKANTQMQDISKLATRLAIDGTPGFVVGDTIVYGEDYDSLAAAIDKAEGHT
ncbi:MAG TPA: thioredoxin domain-containing protein [Caulobacteraceae bacterium]|jgi:protein-disulfide isomerase